MAYSLPRDGWTWSLIVLTSINKETKTPVLDIHIFQSFYVNTIMGAKNITSHISNKMCSASHTHHKDQNTTLSHVTLPWGLRVYWTLDYLHSINIRPTQTGWTTPEQGANCIMIDAGARHNSSMYGKRELWRKRDRANVVQQQARLSKMLSRTVRPPNVKYYL